MNDRFISGNRIQSEESHWINKARLASIAKIVAEGKKLYLANHVNEAITKLTSAIGYCRKEIDDDYEKVNALYWRACCYRTQGKQDLAIQDLKNAIPIIQANPNRVPGYLNSFREITECYKEKNEFGQARVWGETLLNLTPIVSDDFKNHAVILANIYIALNEFDFAEALLLEVKKKHPDYKDVYTMLHKAAYGKACEYTHQESPVEAQVMFKKALEYLEKIDIEEEPYKTITNIGKANVAYRLKDRDNALKYYTAALNNPYKENINWAVLMGIINYVLGKLHNNADEYKQANEYFKNYFTNRKVDSYNSLAFYRFSNLYNYGLGVTQDKATAKKLLQQLASYPYLQDHLSKKVASKLNELKDIDVSQENSLYRQNPFVLYGAVPKPVAQAIVHQEKKKGCTIM